MTLDELMQRYDGTLSEQELEEAGQAAWGHLTQQTMGRIQDPDCGDDPGLAEAADLCFRELVECIHGFGAHGQLTRETVGDWTRTYASGSACLEEQCRGIIRRWLGETALLYRGWPA